MHQKLPVGFLLSVQRKSRWEQSSTARYTDEVFPALTVCAACHSFLQH